MGGVVLLILLYILSDNLPPEKINRLLLLEARSKSLSDNLVSDRIIKADKVNLFPEPYLSYLRFVPESHDCFFISVPNCLPEGPHQDIRCHVLVGSRLDSPCLCLARQENDAAAAVSIPGRVCHASLKVFAYC